MKTNCVIQRSAVLFCAVVFCSGAAFGQQGVVNPATGTPASSVARAGGIDPATGLPMLSPEQADAANSFQVYLELEKLMSSGEFDEALKRCLALYEQRKARTSMTGAFKIWGELSRRSILAKQTLVKIRDEEVREFAEGRGYSDLFREMRDINSALNEDDATYALFVSFRDKDPELARRCLVWANDLLVAKGDYQWLYDHMGDAQQKFEMMHQSLKAQLDVQARVTAQAAATKQLMEERRRQSGQASFATFQPPDTSTRLKQLAENGFIGQTRQLIEILVATGHKADAQKIHDQAVTILNDQRLQSAVSDAEMKLRK